MNKELLKIQLSKILDSEISDSDTIIALENAISEALPYDHDASNPAVACRLEEPIQFGLESIGKLSEAVNKVEKTTSKRKLAFVLIQLIIRNETKESPIDLLESDLSNWIKKMYS